MGQRDRPAAFEADRPRQSSSRSRGLSTIRRCIATAARQTKEGERKTKEGEIVASYNLQLRYPIHINNTECRLSALRQALNALGKPALDNYYACDVTALADKEVGVRRWSLRRVGYFP